MSYDNLAWQGRNTTLTPKTIEWKDVGSNLSKQLDGIVQAENRKMEIKRQNEFLLQRDSIQNDYKVASAQKLEEFNRSENSKNRSVQVDIATMNDSTQNRSIDQRDKASIRSNDTQIYGIDKRDEASIRSNDTQIYGIDKRDEASIRSDNTQNRGIDQRENASIRSDKTQRYGIVQREKASIRSDLTQRYGIDKRDEASIRSDKTQRFGIRQRENASIRSNNTQILGIKERALASIRSNNTQRYGIGVRASTARRGQDVQIAGIKQREKASRRSVGAQYANMSNQRYIARLRESAANKRLAYQNYTPAIDTSGLQTDGLVDKTDFYGETKILKGKEFKDANKKELKNIKTLNEDVAIIQKYKEFKEKNKGSYMGLRKKNPYKDKVEKIKRKKLNGSPIFDENLNLNERLTAEDWKSYSANSRKQVKSTKKVYDPKVQAKQIRNAKTILVKKAGLSTDKRIRNAYMDQAKSLDGIMDDFNKLEEAKIALRKDSLKMANNRKAKREESMISGYQSLITSKRFLELDEDERQSLLISSFGKKNVSKIQREIDLN